MVYFNSVNMADIRDIERTRGGARLNCLVQIQMGLFQSEYQ